MERIRRPSGRTVSLLEVLSEKPHSWRYGYELTQITGLKSGTLYPILMRLSDRGLLDSRWQPAKQPGRPPRHVYRLTASGATFAREALGQVADLGGRGLAGEVG
ncbi:MAG TPA: PadR family transcriptional regulator [Steroidobacteraceae bacterium]